MTAYVVELTTAAAKGLRKLDKTPLSRVIAALTQLEADPRPASARKLVGFDEAWRIRVGDYRVLYEIHDDTVLVVVFRVAHRRESYRDL